MEKDTMERTGCALETHLAEIMDVIDSNGGRIPSRRMLADIHETLECMYWAASMPKPEAAKPEAKAKSL